MPVLKPGDLRQHQLEILEQIAHVGVVRDRRVEQQARASQQVAGARCQLCVGTTGSRLGWQRVGDIPEYALFPNGGFCSTTVFYRKI